MIPEMEYGIRHPGADLVMVALDFARAIQRAGDIHDGQAAGGTCGECGSDQPHYVVARPAGSDTRWLAVAASKPAPMATAPRYGIRHPGSEAVNEQSSLSAATLALEHIGECQAAMGLCSACGSSWDHDLMVSHGGMPWTRVVFPSTPESVDSTVLRQMEDLGRVVVDLARQNASLRAQLLDMTTRLNDFLNELRKAAP